VGSGEWLGMAELLLDAPCLCDVLAEEGGSAAVSATQEELAEAIGASRETVNRHLGRLEAQGLLRVGRGAVEILDADSLRRLAELPPA
jgi:CRP/FNR family transcriptional regulator